MTIDVDHVGFSVNVSSVVNFFTLFIADEIFLLPDDIPEDIFCGFADGINTADEELISFDELFDSFDLDDLQAVFLLIFDGFVVDNLFELQLFFLLLLPFAGIIIFLLHKLSLSDMKLY